VMCTTCNKWTHKRCGRIKGSLSKVRNFVYNKCNGVKELEAKTTKVEIEQGVSLERVAKFCYQGDMISEVGVCGFE
jgi:hypothetical protein